MASDDNPEPKHHSILELIKNSNVSSSIITYLLSTSSIIPFPYGPDRITITIFPSPYTLAPSLLITS